MTELPLCLMSAPDYPGLMILCFYDRFGVAYYFYGTYDLTDGVLTVAPGEAPTGDAAAEVEGMYPLQEKVCYSFSLNKGAYRLTTAEGYAINLKNDQNGSMDTVYLVGSASDETHLFQDVRSISLIYEEAQEEEQEDTVCQLTFLDGSTTADGYVYTYYSNIQFVRLRWTQVTRLYNNREETFDEAGSLSVNYYSTFPYGFVIEDNNELYFYQEAIEQDEIP